MKRGTCVKCSQPAVFAARDGISPGGSRSGWKVASAISAGAVMKQGIAVTTLACAACGYFENYADLGALVGATGSWMKVEPQS